jgi:hypothetical protein
VDPNGMGTILKINKLLFLLFTVSFLFCCTKEDKALQGGETVQNEEIEQEDKIIFGNFIKKDNYSLILNLPYEIEDGIDYVFDKDTPMAIDIIEIYADGEKLFFIDDHTEPGPFGSIQKYPIKKDQKEYFISMKWRVRRSGWITWNDGRGLYLEKDVPWIVAPNIDTYTPKTNTYALSSGMKQLVIRYRILSPYLSLSTEDLYEKTYIENFSFFLIIIVDISNIFEL